MKSATKLALVVGGTGLVLAAGSLNAFATWTSVTPTSALQVAAAELPRGETPAVSAAGSDVLVRWKSSILSDGKKVEKYIVTRMGAGKSMVVCDGVSATTCTDKDVAAGTWTWRVRPLTGGWKGTESADSKPLIIPSAKAAPTATGAAAPGATVKQRPAGGASPADPPPVAPSLIESTKAVEVEPTGEPTPTTAPEEPDKGEAAVTPPPTSSSPADDSDK
jgi:hypothetical protein